MNAATIKRLTTPKKITGYAVKRANTNAILLAAVKPKRRNKFNAVKVEADGYTFDSKAEHRRYCELKLLERAGEIDRLTVHPRWGFFGGEDDEMSASYEADFMYFVGHRRVIEDVKSEPTAAIAKFKLQRLLLWKFHGHTVTVIGCPDPLDKRTPK